jgi:hypothetical protein
MEQKRRELTIADVQTTTHFNRKHLKWWIEQAERAFADLDRAKRLERHECRWCFYARESRIAGQATTTKPCDSCGNIETYPTTNTDRVCRPCGERLGICVLCAADIDLVDRRKLERK